MSLRTRRRIPSKQFIEFAFGLILICAWFLPNYAKADSGEIGGDFSLTSHNGQKFHLSSLRGKTVLLFFGYTFCPDVCPAGLADIARLLKSLDYRSQDLQAVFISVDPERDTADRLADYVRWFHPNIIGLTGTRSQIDQVTKQYHAQYRLNKTDSHQVNYSVDHNANLFLINRSGKLNQIIPFGLPFEHKKRALLTMMNTAAAVAK